MAKLRGKDLYNLRVATAAVDTEIATIDTVVDAILLDTAVTQKAVVKTDGASITGNDDLFVITGGAVRARIVGLVTTVLTGAANGDLQIVVTEPAGTVDLNTAPVATDNDAAGTVYTNVAATGVFTPSTSGVFLSSVATLETEYILPIGTVHFRSSAAQTGGVITWYMTYIPLSPDSVVTAAT